MAARWADVIDDTPERGEIIATLSSSLETSTAEVYSRHWSNFVAWCESQVNPPCALPATTGTVLRWLVSVTKGGKVRAGSLQPYLSALNRVHRDLNLEEPALGHLIQQYRRGRAHQQTDAGRAARRVYLPPPVVEGVLLWALALEIPADDRSKTSKRLRSAFRAAVATVFTFCFFARGGTGALLCVKDVRRSAAGVTVTLAKEKGKKTAWDARTITLPPGAIPGLEELLAKWEDFRGPRTAGDCYYALPSERARPRATAIDTWLREILAHLDYEPPAGELWSGHSVRKGAASGAGSRGVSIDRICFLGGWSVHGKAVHDYIDPTCPDSAAGRRFFGWLRPA